MGGRGACLAGACLTGGIHGGGMHGGDMHGRGECMVGGKHDRGAGMAGEMATEASGMHPTGMQSCYILVHTLFCNQIFPH